MIQKEAQIPNRHAFDTWKIVGPMPRILSFAIDSAIAFAIVWASQQVTHAAIDVWRGFFWWIIVLWGWEGFWLTLTGTTPGRRFFGISIYSPRSDGIPHPVQVCLRILTFWISVALLFTGLTPILFRRDRRGWHDLISETITVGKERQLPSPFSQQVGQIFMLFQALAVFSAVGAALLTSSSHPWTLSRQDTKTPYSCDNRDHLVQHTPEVLFAVSISPAWHDCFDRLQTNMGLIADSTLARMAWFANKHFELWALTSEARSDYYERSIASAPTSPQILELEKEADTWLGNYATLASQLSRESDPAKRIELLSVNQNHFDNPLVRSAIADRIWSEELALGRRPHQPAPQSFNEDWNREQICWLDALGIESHSECRDSNYHEAVTAIYELFNGADINDIRDRLSRLELGSHEADFAYLLLASKAKETGNTVEFRASLAQIPQTSPVRKLAGQLEFSK